MGWQDAPVVEEAAWQSAPVVDEKPPEKKESKDSGIMRGLGLSARAVGPTAAAAMAGGAIGSIVPGVGTAGGALAGAGAMTLAQIVDSVTGMNVTQRIMDKMGLPKPETPGERVVSDIQGAVAGMPGFAGVGNTMATAASPVVRRIGETLSLTNAPKVQLASTVAGTGAASTTREMGGGPIAQLAAGLAGGVAAPWGLQKVGNTIPNMVAKGINKSAETPFAQEGERLARDTGIDLSLGARTGNKQVLALENAARQYGPTADRVQNIDVRTANQAIDRVKELAGKISANRADPNVLGQQIQATVKDAAKKIDTMRNTAASRDYGVVRTIAGDRPVIGMTNLEAELKSIIAENENVILPAGSDMAKVVAQAKTMLEQVQGRLGNTVTEATKTRSAYGEAARGGANVFDNISPAKNRAIASRLFGAVNRDFELAGETLGGPLKEALNVANARYKSFSQSLEYLEMSAIGKLVGDDLVDAAMSGRGLNTTAGEEIVKRISGLHPSTRAASMEILNRWNPQLVKDLKAGVLMDALDAGMSIPPSAKGASQVPLSFNRFVTALGSTKAGFERNLESYGFSKKEIADIRDTATAMMRAGDKTGFNYSNTNVQKDTMEVASAIGSAATSGMVWGPAAGMRAGGKLLLEIKGKQIGLEKVANAMESEAGRRALRTIVSPKASPQAVLASFAEIAGEE